MSAKGAELEEERNGRAAEAERVKALEGELSGVKGELDVERRRKGEAQQLAEELKQQLSAKGAELEEERNGRAAEAGVKALRRAVWRKGELDARAKEKGRCSSWLRS